LQYYGDDVKVADVKRELEVLEGIPYAQLVLVHAGQELTNDINLSRHGLSEYNRSNEILIDLQESPGPLRSCTGPP
jgi:hypothetical protein